MTTPDYSATTLEAAQANTLAAIKGQVANLNDQLKGVYLTGFNNWAISVTAGRAPNTDPPKPPSSYVVGYFTDPTSGPGVPPYGVPVQWAYPAVGTQPVCEMPPVPGVVVHAAGTGKIGIAIPGGRGVWFQALDGDTTPDGTVAPGTSADGVHGLFQKVGFPMGAGWFQKIG